MIDPNAINWTDRLFPVTEHFTVGDCLMLHTWGRLATARDGADFGKLVALCEKLEQVRMVLAVPINVHCMFRSPAYNLQQNIMFPTGIDVHAMNLACDFDCNPHLTIDQVKEALEPRLEALQIRMERGTTTWVHIDLRNPGPSGRYFIP